MIPWLSGKVTSWRQGRWPARILAACAVVVLVAIGALVLWWRRSREAARVHDAYVASVREREAEDRARENGDAARVEALKAEAAAAARRSTWAVARAKEARETHARDRDAIARVRSWDDVAPRRPGR